MGTSGRIGAPDAQKEMGAGELPAAYGTTEAALLPRDPNWMFLYWEITESSRRRLALERGPDIFERGRETLRVHELEPAGLGRRRYFDIPVMFRAGSWYVHVSENGGSYSCELGLAMPDGEFISVVGTNHVNLPPGRVSEEAEGGWLSVSPDFGRLMELSGVEYIGKGSGEVAKSLAQRWEMLNSVFSRAASWGVSSMSSRGAVPPAERKFRLTADCELVLYGATEPDAFVTVAGRRVQLNPDGTFSMRFGLPDGFTDLPVVALSADAQERREVAISVSRRTAGAAV